MIVKKSARKPKRDQESPFFSDENPFQNTSPVPPSTRKKRGAPLVETNQLQATPAISKTKTPKSFTGLSVPPPDTPYTKDSPLATRSMSPLPDSLQSPEKTRTIPRQLPSRNRNQWQPYFSLWILVLGLLAAGYRSIQNELVFCTGQKVFNTGVSIPWNLVPQCIPCPAHSICDSRHIQKCDSPMYTLQPLWIARLISPEYLPFPFDQKFCQDATEALAKEAQKMYKLGLVLNEIVARWVGSAECGDVVMSVENEWAWSQSTPNAKVTGMPISLAKETLKTSLRKKSRNWDDRAFDDLWTKLIQSLAVAPGETKLPALTLVLDDTYHRYRLFQSSTPPIKSISCRLRTGLLEGAQRYSFELTITGALLAILTLLYTRRQTSIKEAQVINRVVEDILDAVQQETQLHQDDRARTPLPGLPLSQLKDHFLPLYSARQRALKPVDPSTGFQCERDVNDRVRWFLDEPSRQRIWSRVYQMLASNASLKEVAMELGGEGQSVLVFIGSPSLGWASPRKEPVVDRF